MVYVLKIEYVPKIDIFGLKMMLKSGLERIPKIVFLNIDSILRVNKMYESVK